MMIGILKKLDKKHPKCGIIYIILNNHPVHIPKKIRRVESLIT